LDVALAIAAGVGVARLTRVRRPRLPVLVLGLFCAGYLAVTLLVVLAPEAFEALMRALWPANEVFDTALLRGRALQALTSPWPVAFELLLGAAAIGLIWFRRGHRWAKPAALALITVPLVVLGPGINQIQPLNRFTWEGSSFISALADTEPVLVAPLDGRSVAQSNQLAINDLRSLQVFFPLSLAATQDLLVDVYPDPTSALARAAGVDTTMSLSADCASGDPIFDSASGYYICELEGHLRPPYWMPGAAVRLPPGVPGGLIRPVDATIDLTTALDEAVPASVEVRDNGYARIQVDAAQNGYVFINRSWWPGWHVTVDGVEVPVYRAFSGQLVPVTAGEHVIEQRLRPWDAALGAVITGATLMVLATFLWASLFRDRRRREVEPAA
jgi:hypothetical protein